MNILIKRLTAVAVSASVLLSSCIFLNSSSNTMTVTAEPSSPILDFAIGDVTMTDSYSTNAFKLELDYLLSFDTEKLLAGFRENAGLSMNNATRYAGWESSLIGGHSVGHYMSAIAQAYQNPTLTNEERQQLYNKMKTLVDGLLVCQQNSKGKPGFIWGAKKIDNNNVEIQFDNVENGKINIMNEAWVPWYTMHKLLAGMVDIYNLTGYQNAKTVASSLGDWVYNRSSKWSASTNQRVLSVEYGGMNDCLYALYQVTGKSTHATAAHYFDETALFETVLGGGANVLNGKHANTTIPKFIGALKRYTTLNGKTLDGQTVDASKYLQYAEAFWDMVINRHTYITGGNSEWEHFGMDHILDAERTNCNCETCNSYNMLKLSRELFKITGNKKYMEYYETTYYNSILSSQNPQTGMTTYFQPMATGYFKVYSSPYNNFWCCTGSGMENFTKLGDTMYMHKGNILYVNMYQSSVLNWSDQNVKIVQNSKIPDGETSSFTVNGNGNLDLRFRIPDWNAGVMTITVNGEKYSYKTVDGYAQVSRSFSNGDVVNITIPEEVTAYALPDVSNSYGFKYGPVVLSAQLGTSDMNQTTTGMSVSIPKDKIVSSEKITIKNGNGSVSSFMLNINDYLVKAPDSLTFNLKGTDTNLTFTPHYRQYTQRYGIYWYFYSADQSTDDDTIRAKTTVLDTVQPGYGQYENDDLHYMTDHNSVAVTSDSTYRYAKENGYFSYRMIVDENATYNILQITLRKEDNGKSVKVKIGDVVVYAKTLNYTGDASVYNVKIIIPNDVISKYIYTVDAYDTPNEVVDVTFSSNDNKESAKICDFIYTTAVKPLYSMDSSIAYFVDCGDHNTLTATGSDKYGYLNSLTEQIYGADSVTGLKWGLVDDPTDQYNGSSKSKGLYTANTWPDEYNTSDGADKASSFRYTKNQYENNIDRHLDYAFELPNGKYSVEIGFTNPWNCSNNPTVYANYGTDNQSIVAQSVAISGSAKATGTVNVTNSNLTLNFRTQDKAINVSYIIIKYDTLDPLPVEMIAGDINIDGKIDALDLSFAKNGLMYGFKKPAMQYRADVNNDGKADAYDVKALRSFLLGKSEVLS